MDILCVITPQHRCTHSTKAASARRLRSRPVGSLSLLTLCSPSRRTQAAAGRVPHSAGTNTTRQPHFCLYPDTQAYRYQQHLTSTPRTCCTHNPDIQSTAARRSATSHRAGEHFTHKVETQFCSLLGTNGYKRPCDAFNVTV